MTDFQEEAESKPGRTEGLGDREDLGQASPSKMAYVQKATRTTQQKYNPI